MTTELMKNVSLRTGSGAVLLTEFYMVGDDEECPITDVETVAKLSPTAESYYLTKFDELYPKTEEEEIPEVIKDKVNVVIGNFSKSNKKMH